MSADLRVDNILIQVTSRLRENGIKLWLQPYYTEGLGPCNTELEHLAINFSHALGIPTESCLMALSELQNTAIDKLNARREFADNGVATIKVRAPTQSSSGTRLVTVKINLNQLGSEFHQVVADTLQLPWRSIKIINAGKFLVDEITLSQQNICNNQQVMAIIVSGERAETLGETSSAVAGTSSGSATASLESDDNIHAKLVKAREDAEMLTSEQDYSFMEMEDQAGNAIHLPPAERRNLLIALALHEKGKAALKKERYSEALLMFMEADGEYQSCTTSLLDSVDNWALLNLDIVWCYLCLRSISQLPEAEKRLYICEKSFKKSYGENLDRVVQLKGNAANEQALIMRLHLLMAVVMFHQNRRNESRAMLQMAELELQRLKVSDSSLNMLVEMGYEVAESRIALRATQGVVENAVTHILTQRNERAEARRKSKAEKRLKIGRSKDKTWINPRSLHVLIEMGFPQELCEVALRKTNNNITRSIQMLQENSNELRIQLLDDVVPAEKAIAELEEMGFHSVMAKLALQHSLNNVDNAIASMIKMQNDGTYEAVLNDMLTFLAANNVPLTASTSEEGAVGGLLAKSSAQKKCDELQAKTMEAFERFSEDISADDDDHLDLPLLQEEKLLNEYKRFLDM